MWGIGSKGRFKGGAATRGDMCTIMTANAYQSFYLYGHRMALGSWFPNQSGFWLAIKKVGNLAIKHPGRRRRQRLLASSPCSTKHMSVFSVTWNTAKPELRGSLSKRTGT